MNGQANQKIEIFVILEDIPDCSNSPNVNFIMADPLSIVAGVAGLISLGIQVAQSLVDFYTLYKHQDSELVGTIEKLDILVIILKSLKKSLSDRKFQVDEISLIEKIETSIENCKDLIHDLQGECQKFSKATSSGIKGIVKAAGRRAIYPFRQSTLQKLDEDISELRGNLSIALDVLQLKDNKMIEDGIADMKLLLNLVRANQISENIRDWLKAPDATVNHNAAYAKRHFGTGAWFVQSSRFETWLIEGNSILWLNGFAGSGKSVLASTAIQFAFRHRRSDPSIGIAFFYFTFNDGSKQDESAMLRALLVQLSGQLQDGYSDLTRLYDSFKPGIPTSSVLTDYLRRLIERFRHVYIILDALDEIPRYGAREDVLDRIEMMHNWSFTGLHLLVTSRDLSDIRSSLNLSFDQEVKMRNAGIDKDIENFISSRLHDDRRLEKWLPYCSKIKETLVKGAQGV